MICLCFLHPSLRNYDRIGLRRIGTSKEKEVCYDTVFPRIVREASYTNVVSTTWMSKYDLNKDDTIRNAVTEKKGYMKISSSSKELEAN